VIEKLWLTASVKAALETLKMHERKDKESVVLATNVELLERSAMVFNLSASLVPPRTEIALIPQIQNAEASNPATFEL
jgi:hypothetical protein